MSKSKKSNKDKKKDNKKSCESSKPKTSAEAKGDSKTPAVAEKAIGNATPEQISKNKELLEKIFSLLENLKPDQVTKSSKVDLDRVQQFIKNITFRDAGMANRVHEVPLSDKQKAVIKDGAEKINFIQTK